MMTGMRTRGQPGTDLRCHQLVELVTDYLEDALNADTASRFANHVTGCRGCTEYVEQTRATVRLLGRISCEGLSELATARLRAAFRDLS